MVGYSGYMTPSIVDPQTCPGLEQYAIKRFSEALEEVVKAIAENAGMKVCPESDPKLLCVLCV